MVLVVVSTIFFHLIILSDGSNINRLEIKKKNDLMLLLYYRIKRPRRVNACGYQTGLTLLLNPEPDDYLGTLIGSYGSKVNLIKKNNK